MTWERSADNTAINAQFLLLLSICLTFRLRLQMTVTAQLSAVVCQVNTCHFITVTAHVGSLLGVCLDSPVRPEIKRNQIDSKRNNPRNQ